MHHDLIDLSPPADEVDDPGCVFGSEEQIEGKRALLGDVGEVQAQNGLELRRERNREMLRVTDRDAHLPAKRLVGFSSFAGQDEETWRLHVPGAREQSLDKVRLVPTM
jgi:hypothetical protein